MEKTAKLQKYEHKLTLIKSMVKFVKYDFKTIIKK